MRSVFAASQRRGRLLDWHRFVRDVSKRWRAHSDCARVDASSPSASARMLPERSALPINDRVKCNDSLHCFVSRSRPWPCRSRAPAGPRLHSVPVYVPQVAPSRASDRGRNNLAVPTVIRHLANKNQVAGCAPRATIQRHSGGATADRCCA
jgi:hypothetical protein